MNTTILIYSSLSVPAELAEQANKIRLANKNKWYQISLENETTGKKTGLKCFGTWIQLCTDKTVYNGGMMDVSATEFKKEIETILTRLIEIY